MNVRNFTLLSLAVLILMCASVGAFPWYVGMCLLVLTAAIARIASGASDIMNATNPVGWDHAETACEAMDDTPVSPYLTLPLRRYEDIARKS